MLLLPSGLCGRQDVEDSSYLQCRHLIPALNMWAARAEYTTARSIATHFPWHGCMYDLQLNVALVRKLRGSLKCLAYFLDMSFMVVCTTRHWQTSGRLVQELNVCTVGEQGFL